MTLFDEGSNHAAAPILRISWVTARNQIFALRAFGGAATTDAAPKAHAPEAIPPRTIKERRVHSIDFLAHLSVAFCSFVGAPQSCSTSETSQRKQLQIVCRLRIRRQISQHFAENTRKLEAMSREPCRQRHLRKFRMRIDDKMLIRSVISVSGGNKGKVPFESKKRPLIKFV